MQSSRLSRDPRRTVPRALITTILVTIVLAFPIGVLAAVYLELTGGAQSGLALEPGASAALYQPGKERPTVRAPRPKPLSPRVTGAEAAAHEAFVAGLSGKIIWKI